MKRVCIECGLEHTDSADAFCFKCGGKIVEKKEDWEVKTCKICSKKNYLPKSAMNLCDYHYEIYDANEGWN